MKKIFSYTTIFVLLIVSGFFIYQYVSWTRLPQSEQYPVTRVQASDRYMAEIEESSRYLKTVVDSLNVPSISVAIGIKGEVVWSETVGFANLERRVPATPETAYRIGSTSKAITATAFMLLADQGKIDMNQPANPLIPSLPASFPNITTRQLLSHTAGFGNYEDFLQSAFYTLCNCVQFDSVDEALTLFIETPLLYEPGEEFRYSTFDVIAASKVIESITHQPFLMFLKKQLFEPLGMNHSFGDHGPYQILPIVTFYEIANESYRKWHTLDISPHETNLSYKWAGGGLLSTPTDLVKMGNALVADSTFISFETRNEFFTPQKLNNNKVNYQKYAIGWRSYYEYGTELLLGENTPVWMVHHGGVSKGSLNLLALFPDYQLVIDASINGRKNNLVFGNFWVEVMRLVKPFIIRLHRESNLKKPGANF